MKLVNSVDVVSQMGARSYNKGMRLTGGVIDRMEDHSIEYADGTSENLILIMSEGNLIGRLVNVPMAIEYE